MYLLYMCVAWSIGQHAYFWKNSKNWHLQNSIVPRCKQSIPCDRVMARPWSAVVWPWSIMVGHDMTIIWPWSDYGQPCLLNGMMVITMVDHAQTVMVIPWSMMVKSDKLTMVSQGLNDHELTINWPWTDHQSDHGSTMVVRLSVATYSDGQTW